MDSIATDWGKKLTEVSKRIDIEADPAFQLKRATEIKARQKEYIQRRQEKEKDLYNIHVRHLEDGKDPRDCKNQLVLLRLTKKQADSWLKKLKTILIDNDKRIVRYYEKVKVNGQGSSVLDNEYPGDSVIKINPLEPKIEIIKGDVRHDEIFG